MRKLKNYAIFAVVGVLALVGAACETGGTQPSATAKDKALAARSLDDLQRAHPTPKFAKSQLRQNLVDLITAQAETTQTTSFFFNQGVTDPIMSCPSIGFPIASTAQLTNPVQTVTKGTDGITTIGQVEPTGIYSGDSSGTYVICIDAKGKAYAAYWEGFVQAITGPAEWNRQSKQVELIGPPSFSFSTSK